MRRAAGVAAGDRIEQGKWEDWEWIIDINLKGVWLCMKYEIAAMLQSGGGAIVNVTSGVALAAVPVHGRARRFARLGHRQGRLLDAAAGRRPFRQACSVS